jgi:hypothetical protein
MFVRGVKGRKAPYAIKLLTKMQLSELLNKIDNTESQSKKTIRIKGLTAVLFSDAPLD